MTINTWWYKHEKENGRFRKLPYRAYFRDGLRVVERAAWEHDNGSIWVVMNNKAFRLKWCRVEVDYCGDRFIVGRI